MKRFYFTRSISGFIDLPDSTDNQEVREKLMNYDVLKMCHINKEFIQIHKSHIVGSQISEDITNNNSSHKNIFTRLLSNN